MTFLRTAVATAALVTIGAGAHAASWDFATDAEAFFDASAAIETNKYEGTFEQVYGPGGADGGGITVNASAYNNGGEAHPFMDSRGNNNGDDVAGLGVCSSGFVGAISNCSTNYGSETGDDNLMYPEVLELTFSDSVRLRDLFLRDALHDPLNGTVAIGWNGGSGVFDVIAGVVQDLGMAGFGNTFLFTSGGALGCNGVAEATKAIVTNDCEYEELYLSTLTASVPVPAAGFLLLGGLGGLMAFRRRKS